MSRSRVARPNPEEGRLYLPAAPPPTSGMRLKTVNMMYVDVPVATGLNMLSLLLIQILSLCTHTQSQGERFFGTRQSVSKPSVVSRS